MGTGARDNAIDIRRISGFTKLIDGILKVVDGFEAKAEGYMPFTPVNITYRQLNKAAKTILDVGCGKGDPMLFINRRRRFRTAGVDIFSDYIEICREKHSHDELFQQDIRKLTFPAKSFDIVLGLRVLEHFTKAEGEAILQKLEAIACSQVILVTPIEDFKQSAYDHNEFQQHKSAWSPEELRNLGYTVYPNGLKGVQKDSATITRFQKIVAGLGHILWVFVGPVVIVFPSLAANAVAVKSIRATNNSFPA